MYKLSSDKTKSALRKAGYSSLSELAGSIGIHRNTLNHFLNGAGVFPQSLEKLFAALRVEPFEIIENSKKRYSPKLISHVIDALNREAPECCFILFGSRAIGREKQFSDFDVGIFRNEKLSFSEFSNLKNIVDDLTQDLPVSVDIVNLTNADEAFLKNISHGYIFLGGSPKSLEKLEGRFRGSKT